MRNIVIILTFESWYLNNYTRTRVVVFLLLVIFFFFWYHATSDYYGIVFIKKFDFSYILIKKMFFIIFYNALFLQFYHDVYLKIFEFYLDKPNTIMKSRRYGK